MKNKLGTIALVISFASWIILLSVPSSLLFLAKPYTNFDGLETWGFFVGTILFLIGSALFITIISLVVYSSKKKENILYGVLAVIIFLSTPLVYALLYEYIFILNRFILNN